MRINKSIFRYIEYELFNYECTKKEMAQYKEEILEGSSMPEVNVKSGLGNITESKAIKLTSSAFIKKAERTIKAIDMSLAILDEKHRILFKLKYLDCIPWQEVAMELGVSDRSYFRLRREIVTAVGQQLGLINIE